MGQRLQDEPEEAAQAASAGSSSSAAQPQQPPCQLRPAGPSFGREEQSSNTPAVPTQENPRPPTRRSFSNLCAELEELDATMQDLLSEDDNVPADLFFAEFFRLQDALRRLRDDVDYAMECMDEEEMK